MNKIINALSKDSTNKTIKTIGYVFLIINIHLLPTFSYLTNIVFLIICNFFEYSTLLFVGYSVLYHIIKRDLFQSIARPFIIFAVFIVYSLITTLLTSGFSFSIFKELLKMITCASFLYVTLDYVDSKKKMNFLLYAFLHSIVIMFASTFYYNKDSLGNIKEAFTGGKYRFGEKENQSNGYAVYCVLCVFTLLLLFLRTKKIYFLISIIVPTVFCVGTQSKKGIILCFFLMIFAIYKLLDNYIKDTTVVLLVFLIVLVAIIAGTLIITARLNIFKRFINVLNGTDASTEGRADMFEFAFYDSAKCLFLGHGLGTFPANFYRYSGTTLTFHSSLGNTFYSSGLFGLIIWLFFILYLFKDNRSGSIYFSLIIFFELFLPFNDLTMQIWSQQIIFVFTGLCS